MFPRVVLGNDFALRFFSCIYRVMYWTLKRIITWAGILTFTGFMVFYGYYQSRQIIAGPLIVIKAPANYSTATSSLIRVSGQVLRAKELRLDGRAIFVDLSGNFDEKLLLADGYNIILLAAKDAEGHEANKTLELVWNESSRSPGIVSPKPHPSLATGTNKLLNNR
jgi:hypothetical protein